MVSVTDNQARTAVENSRRVLFCKRAKNERSLSLKKIEAVIVEVMRKHDFLRNVKVDGM